MQFDSVDCLSDFMTPVCWSHSKYPACRHTGVQRKRERLRHSDVTARLKRAIRCNAAHRLTVGSVFLWKTKEMCGDLDNSKE